MNDTTQSLIRSGLKIGAGYLVGKGVTDESTAMEIVGIVMGLLGIFWGVKHRAPAKKKTRLVNSNLMLLLLSAICPLLFTPGCATQKNKLSERIYADGSSEKTSETTTRTFFDSKTSLAKLKTSNTDKTQSIGISDLSQESSGSNVVNFVDVAVQAAVKGAVKSVVPVP